MYLKKCIGALCSQKSAELHWVKWVHIFQGETHCLECLALDGCLFLRGKTPPWPHHPNCHCVLDSVDEIVVRIISSAHSDYTKFNPYLFNTQGRYSHGKEKLFAQWGYTVADAQWLQAEMERQALEKYRNGEYELGKLNVFGQRINIRIEIPKKNGNGIVSFSSGWMVESGGKLKLNTPCGGK